MLLFQIVAIELPCIDPVLRVRLLQMYKQFLSQSKIDEKSFKTTLNLTTDQFFFVTYAMVSHR